jgi:phospholipid transport system substrate-binding protein
MREGIVLTAFVAFLLSVSVHVHAAEPLDTIRNSTDGVLEIVKDPFYGDGTKKELQREMIRAKIHDMFDFSEMAKKVLGRSWEVFTSKQQTEFSDLFSEFLEGLYISRIQQYTNGKILYLGEKMTSRLKAAVKTKLVTGTSETPIDYTMTRKKDGWKIYDVTVEGVSLIKNYRAQFRKILAKGSPDKLIERLKKKVDQIRSSKLALVSECLNIYLSKLRTYYR